MTYQVGDRLIEHLYSGFPTRRLWKIRVVEVTQIHKGNGSIKVTGDEQFRRARLSGEFSPFTTEKWQELVALIQEQKDAVKFLKAVDNMTQKDAAAMWHKMPDDLKKLGQETS